MNPFVAWAGVLAVIGIVFSLSTFSDVRWSGIEVHGHRQGGIVYFRYDGEQYSVDDIGDDFPTRR